MTLDEKYNKWNDLFWKRFIYASTNDEQGSNIPISSINFDTGRGDVGDGTINLSELMQFIYVCDLNQVEQPISMYDCVKVISRLEKEAYTYFLNYFKNYAYPNTSYYPGFFLRDDIPYYGDQADKINESLGLNMIASNLGSLMSPDTEDPCYSPFVSQDQVWNLNPMLKIVADGTYNASTKEAARSVGYDINYYIKENKYTIYNPYLSYIKHFFCYCPTFNTNKVKPWDRQEDREKHFKPDIKVKRGANNWYYSGGTSSCVDAFDSRASEGYNHTLRTFLYRGVVWFLDMVYEPVLRLFGKEFKHNSYYCYAATSGIWYGPRFRKRIVEQFNKSFDRGFGLFNPNIVFIAGEHDLIDWDKAKKWLEEYPEPTESGTVSSPLTFMYIYQWFNYRTK